MIDIKEGVELAETIEKIGKVANFDDLTPKNIKTITNAISIVNEFNAKINLYGERIFKSMYLDNIDGWLSRLSPKDIKKVFGDNPKPGNPNQKFVLCYKTMQILVAYYDVRSGWCMGARSGTTTEYQFQGDFLIVRNTWTTQKSRHSHIPWVNRERVITINLKTREATVEGDSISEGY